MGQTAEELSMVERVAICLKIELIPELMAAPIY